MSDNATVSSEQADRPAPPPFDPDPELIAHLEGNEFALKGYRRKAQELRDEARRDGGPSHA